MEGKPHQFSSEHLLVDNGHLHEQMLQIFGEIFQAKYRVPMPMID